METAFNEGRMWHGLGLLHLAVPAYERCLAVAEEEERGRGGGQKDGDGDMEMAGVQPEDEDLWDEPGYTREAAYALQQMYGIGGSMQAARAVTEKWLVF